MIPRQARPGLSRLHARRRRVLARKMRAGFFMIEVVVLMSILVVGFLSLASTSVAVHSLKGSDDQQRLAAGAMESVLEDIRRTSREQLSTPGDWSTAVAAAFAAGGNPGSQIAINGLTPQGAAAGACTVQVILDETQTDAALGVNMGMPRDLDNDATVDNADVRGSAVLLPVVVRLQWTGRSGNRQMTRALWLSGY